MTSDAHYAVRTWLEMAAENRGTDRFQVSYAAFQSILRGAALTRAELAGLMDTPHADALNLIESMVTEGRLRVDEQGERVVGAGGLSLQKSRHTLVIGSRRFGVWCALDAVGIPAGLAVNAIVESHCSDTGEAVKIEIKSGKIAETSPETLWITLAPASLEKSVFDTL